MNKRENLNKLLKILTKYLNLNITFAKDYQKFWQ